jgi:hypothetical protein
MKYLTMMLILLCVSMLSAVSIQSIRAEDYNNAVCRMVLDMDEDVDFSIAKRDDGFFVSIPNFDGNVPENNLGATFLNRLEGAPGELKIVSSEDLGYHTMWLSDAQALVIDFFSQSQDKHDRLTIARFLADKGRLASADSAFHKLAIDYPNHYDILYYWGKLLIKRGSSRAAEKLAQIPMSSSYYSAAQSLIKPEDHSPQSDAMNAETTQTLELMPTPVIEDEQPEELAQPMDSIITVIPAAEIYTEKPSLLSSAADLASRYFVLTIILFVAILVILCMLIFGSFKRSPKLSKTNIEESSLNLDTETMCKMVNRLLADGWTNKEIARELKISLHETELIIRRLHYMGIHEDDAKS